MYSECLVLYLPLGSHQMSQVQLSGVLTMALVPVRAQQEVSDWHLQASYFSSNRNHRGNPSHQGQVLPVSFELPDRAPQLADLGARYRNLYPLYRLFWLLEHREYHPFVWARH